MRSRQKEVKVYDERLAATSDITYLGAIKGCCPAYTVVILLPEAVDWRRTALLAMARLLLLLLLWADAHTGRPANVLADCIMCIVNNIYLKLVEGMGGSQCRLCLVEGSIDPCDEEGALGMQYSLN